MTDEGGLNHPVITEPTIEGLLSQLESTEMLYIHGMDGEILAIVLPVGGWWQEQLPEAPEDHFSHAHIRIDGRVP